MKKSTGDLVRVKLVKFQIFSPSCIYVMILKLKENGLNRRIRRGV